ncbi:hypothetical protein BTJ68_09553 [Hortaea werneckii EXF-2000]|uniref:Uncharacterized protein n=1 Tax=Hortaea werneckii EXF-2000 TaxID=1157616 RepID=A0A1Z5T1J5_HORWE|nr:hypothetical protein BTJ68_09553 [Hortaea werneckii EXF-2000]
MDGPLRFRAERGVSGLSQRTFRWESQGRPTEPNHMDLDQQFCRIALGTSRHVFRHLAPHCYGRFDDD